MRLRGENVLVIGLAVAGLLAPVGSSFAQVKRQMEGKPEAPKATTTPTDEWQPKSTAYVKASNTKEDALFGFALRSVATATLSPWAPSGRTAPPKALTAFQRPRPNCRRSICLHAQHYRLETASLPQSL